LRTLVNQPPVGDLGKSYRDKLYPIHSCKAPIDDRAACNRFLGRALESIFGNTDFKAGPDDYMLANDIAMSLEGSVPGWKKLGEADDQAVLQSASDRANRGDIVAAKPGGSHGHVALILLGPLDATSTEKGWDGLSTPNSGAFRLDHPELVYIGCPLSEPGWKKPQGVGPYAKRP
jgi:hypothetical protein